jgi:NADH-quinone oxidoreductase subunit M
MLWMLQRVMLGQVPNRAMGLLPDLSVREIAVLAPLAVVIFGIGLYPGPLMETMDVSVNTLVHKMQALHR